MICFPTGKVVAPATKGGCISEARRAVVWFSDGRSPVVKVFAAKGGIKNGAREGAHLASGHGQPTNR